MADGVKQVWIFNLGILHSGNRDMGKLWRFIGGDITKFYCTPLISNYQHIKFKAASLIVYEIYGPQCDKTCLRGFKRESN